MILNTLEEYKAHLRKEYAWNKCPKKSDRVNIPEEIWSQIDWTEDEKYRNAALPHKMWNMRHDDHFWPWCHEWRGDDAFGPRAGVGHPKYKQSPPQLVKGRGIARWMAPGDVSILEIPALADPNKWWTKENIPEVLIAIERMNDHRLKGQEIAIKKEDLFSGYGPSPLQKFSESSYLVTDPYHISWHKMIKRRQYLGDRTDTGEKDTVLFFRLGWRFDSLDQYYIRDAHFLGLRWN